MKLSVVVCSGGRKKSLKKTLLSLEKQSFKDFEIVVVGKSVSLTKVGPLLKRVEDLGQGLARARDLGWRRARGEIVSFVDDDAVLSRRWAENLVEIFESDKSIGGVSGPTIVPERLLKNRLVFWWQGRDDWLARMWVRWVLQGRPLDVGRIYSNGWWSPGSNFKSCLNLKGLWEVDYLEACNMSLRRELVKKAGGFDLGFKGTGEWCEVDLAMKVRQLGYRLVWSRRVRVRHEVSRSGVYKDRRRIGERVGNYLRFRRRWL